MEAKEEWFETEVNPDLKLSFAIKRVICHDNSYFHEIKVLDTQVFGQVLVIDGKPHSSEVDGFVYYENLVHPALLMHDNPKKVVIMGGGEGSALREVLRHKTIEKVILCERDKVVIDVCKQCFKENWVAFSDPRLEIFIGDTRDFFNCCNEKYDVIIGDMKDPIESGSNNQLYPKSFYQTVIKPKLDEGGIYVTQAGLAGFKSHKTFATVFNTLEQVFQFVLPVTATVPLHADTCGCVMASDTLLLMSSTIIKERINARIEGELRYHDNKSISSATLLNRLMLKELDRYNRNNIIDEDFMVEAMSQHKQQRYR